jgi:hypothetical protein
MKYIAHRGNINGPDLGRENWPQYIYDALNLGYDVEIDVWWENKFFLGHDLPQHEVAEDFLLQDNLWIHAKNIAALWKLKDKTNCFFHNTDNAVLTSKNYIWTYPGKELTENCISVMPEKADYTDRELSKCYGICSDYVKNYKK